MCCFDFTVLKENLENKGYKVVVFENKNDATEYLKGKIEGKTIGFGGSVTIKEMDLISALSPKNTIFWHDARPEGLSVMETRTLAARADIYISSVNGISEKGEIIKVDQARGINKALQKMTEHVLNTGGTMGSRRYNIYKNQIFRFQYRQLF